MEFLILVGFCLLVFGIAVRTAGRRNTEVDDEELARRANAEAERHRYGDGYF
jgi:hypothetical protein